MYDDWCICQPAGGTSQPTGGTGGSLHRKGVLYCLFMIASMSVSVLE